MEIFGAVVLAGGAARRMGGAPKPVLPVAGRSMLDRVLAAVAGAHERVVVGPAGLGLPPGVRLTCEQPPGGGPVAAAAAGLAHIGPGTPTVALLAADLPLLTADAVDRLREALAGPPADGAGPPADGAGPPADGAGPPADGAVYVDEGGRRQTLCGLWRTATLRAALDRLAARRGGLAGASLRAALAGLTVTEVPWPGSDAPPWFDCDTDADLRQAEEWSRMSREDTT